jgi:phosphoribosylanthranilate isomerase
MFEDRSGDPGRLCVKICGITNEKDALAAVESGADALGFNLFPGSKRCIDIEVEAAWISKLPADVSKIAVMVDPSFEDAIRVGRLPFINALQLHGNESPELCRRLANEGVKFAKALPVKDEKSFAAVPSFITTTLVLDSASSGQFGGSGKTFPWRFARQFIAANPSMKVILAGGLTPVNVGQAVREVRPFGVDVTSGVEARPGQKDRRLLQEFIQAARQAWN